MHILCATSRTTIRNHPCGLPMVVRTHQYCTPHPGHRAIGLDRGEDCAVREDVELFGGEGCSMVVLHHVIGCGSVGLFEQEDVIDFPVAELACGFKDLGRDFIDGGFRSGPQPCTRTVELGLLFVPVVIEVCHIDGELFCPLDVYGAREHRFKGLEDRLRGLPYPVLAAREKESHCD